MVWVHDSTPNILLLSSERADWRLLLLLLRTAASLLLLSTEEAGGSAELSSGGGWSGEDEPPTVCLRILVYWITPFVFSISGYIGALLCFFLSRIERYRSKSIQRAPRIFLLTCGLSALALWISATIAGANMHGAITLMQTTSADRQNRRSRV